MSFPPESVRCTRRDHERDDGTRRTVQIYDDGIRAVTFYHHGESWTRYVIVPRPTAIRYLRRLRRKWKRPANDCHWWDWLPLSLLGCEHYGGPGHGFAHAPTQLQYGRRFLVFAQSGGLDV
jgi:hypothetical protein